MAKVKTTKDYLQMNNELEAIISQLQSEDTKIDEALKLYQRGQVLVQELEAYLKSARNQLQKITRLSKEG